MVPNEKKNPVKPVGLKGANSPKGANGGGKPIIQCDGDVCHIIRPGNGVKPTPQNKPVVKPVTVKSPQNKPAAGAVKPAIKPPQNKPAGATPPKGNPIGVIHRINDKNFNAKVGDRAGLSMLFFHLDKGCHPCLEMVPVVKKLVAYYKDRLLVGDVEVLRDGHNDNQTWLLWSSWNKTISPICLFPTFVFFKQGQEVGRTNGFHDEKEMINFINQKFGVK